MGFDPLTLALGVAGAAASAFGTIQSGMAAQSSANYQAKVAENNALIAQQNADYAIKAGNAKVAQEGQKSAERQAAIITGLAANGTDVNKGSALDVREGARKTGLLDEQTAANNAELQAYGYRTQKTSFEAQAGLERAQAEQAPIGAGLSAAGQLFNSASSIGLKWTNKINTGDSDSIGSAAIPAGAGFAVSP